MLYKLEGKFNNKDKRILKEWGDEETRVLKYANSLYYVEISEISNGKGKYNSYECLGYWQSADTRANYMLVTPNRIVESHGEYLIEVKEQKNFWYQGYKSPKNGNFCLILRSSSLLNSFLSCLG